MQMLSRLPGPLGRIASPATLSKGVGVNPPFPAPEGYVWDFVADPDGQVLADPDGELLIDLFKVAA